MDNINGNSGNENDLIKNQYYILDQIRKTHRLFLSEFVALLLFSLIFGIYLLPSITYGVSEIYIAPRILIAFNFGFFIIVELIRTWPYIRDANYYLKKLRIAMSKDNFESSEISQFIQGVNTYLNVFFSLITKGKKSKKKKSFEFSRLKEELTRRYNIKIIAFIIIGVVLIGYCLYLFIDFSFLLPNPLIEGTFIAIILIYCILIYISVKEQYMISQWSAGYLELKSWGENLQNMQSRNEG